MVLPLNKENLLKGLLQYNYFPRAHDHKEELPPIFSSEQFTPEVATKVNALSYRGKQGYDVLPFKRTRHPNIPRMMGIPHPRAYAKLVQNITDNWEQYISKVCQSPNSQISFEVQDDFRIIVHKYEHTAPDGDIEDQDPWSDFGKSYRVKTDITNFFHSIYSHSLPWALVGHTKAKKEKTDKTLWFNQIDASIMLCQRNETKGIPIGSATSSILSEVILFQVDANLRNQKYRFTRYIDDYTAYVESEEEANGFLNALTKELDKYALSLNLKKTHISKMPVLNRELWVTDLNLFFGFGEDDKIDVKGNTVRSPLKYRQIKMILDKASSLSHEYPDGSVMKYAFAGIIDKGFEKSEEVEKYLYNSLLKHAYYFPTLIPVIQRLLNKISFKDFSSEMLIHNLLHQSFKQGQSDNIVWCIYYLLRVTVFNNQTLITRCCDQDDPMVVLMGYVYAKKNKLPLGEIKKWAEKKIKGAKDGSLTEYDIDRFWLVLYQLYFDDVITTLPYAPFDPSKGKDPQDNEVFKVLKKEGVSFVDFKHSDFPKRFKVFI